MSAPRFRARAFHYVMSCYFGLALLGAASKGDVLAAVICLGILVLLRDVCRP